MNDRVAAINFLNEAAKITLPSSDPNDAGLRYAILGSAAQADPTMGMAFYHLATANQDMGMSAGAIACYRKTVELGVGTKPGDIDQNLLTNSLTNMAYELFKIGKLDEAEQAIQRSLDINDQSARAWSVLSQIASVQGRIKDSVEYGKHGYTLDAADPAVEMAYAFALLFSGDYENGLRHFESRYPQRLTHFLKYPFPRWGGEEGKTLFLVSEQGIGDALSFSRFVEEACQRSKHVHIGVQKELVRVFSAAFQHINNLSIVGMPCPFPPADCWTTFMSLPVHMGLTNEEIINRPQIRIPQFGNNPSWKNQNAKLHIGIAWQGSAASDINHHRSFGVENFLELTTIPGVQLYSLQVGDKSSNLHQAGAAGLIRDLAPNIADFSDTIGIMRHLDMGVLVESAVAHMAGHVGLETIIPYSRLGRDWRIGPDGSRHPLWYAKSRAIQQGADCQWEPVFKKIAEIVRDKVDERQSIQAA